MVHNKIWFNFKGVVDFVRPQECEDLSDLRDSIKAKLKDTLVGIDASCISFHDAAGNPLMVGECLENVVTGKTDTDPLVLKLIIPTGTLRFYTNRFCLPGQRACSHCSTFLFADCVWYRSLSAFSALIQSLSSNQPFLVSYALIRTISACMTWPLLRAQRHVPGRHASRFSLLNIVISFFSPSFVVICSANHHNEGYVSQHLPQHNEVVYANNISNHYSP